MPSWGPFLPSLRSYRRIYPSSLNFIPALRKKVESPNYDVSFWEWAREASDHRIRSENISAGASRVPPTSLHLADDGCGGFRVLGMGGRDARRAWSCRLAGLVTSAQPPACDRATGRRPRPAGPDRTEGEWVTPLREGRRLARGLWQARGCPLPEPAPG